MTSHMTLPVSPLKIHKIKTPLYNYQDVCLYRNFLLTAGSIWLFFRVKLCLCPRSVISIIWGEGFHILHWNCPWNKVIPKTFSYLIKFKVVGQSQSQINYKLRDLRILSSHYYKKIFYIIKQLQTCFSLSCLLWS